MVILVKTAFGFLTRLPVRFESPPPPLARAAFAFPLVGLAVGGAGALVLLGALHLGLGPLAAALLALVSQTLITGGLHEDGLADVADGFGGGATRDRKLEIMRDSRIGSFGVLAVVFGIGLRAAALAWIARPEDAAWALVAAGMASRGFLPLVMRRLPPARFDGLGQGAGTPTVPGATAALLLGLAACLGTVGPPAWLAGLAAAATFALLARRQIGGQTGDVLGACQQAAEIAILLIAGARP
ncbi:MAG: adenosylcobinamide-GDP ribazoletransferase [Magnetospirillum sp. WYHS-4]